MRLVYLFAREKVGEAWWFGIRLAGVTLVVWLGDERGG